MISQIQTGFYNALKLYPEDWASTTAYSVGDLVKASTYNSHAYKCTTPGTSGATEPTWTTTNGNTNTDGTVTWTCYDQKCYNVKAPQSASVPYIVYSLETERPDGEFGDFEAIENVNFYVNCFSDKSMADVSELVDEVASALDNANLTVSGYTNMSCVRTFIGSPIYEADTGIYQIPLRYLVLLDKA